jgi:hypothetical protein
VFMARSLILIAIVILDTTRCSPMSKERAASSSSKASRLRLFGPPPLLEGEDAAAYNELLARVSGAVKPSDVIEEIWVRDIVDLTWEIFRWRRLKAKVLAVVAPEVTFSRFMDSFEKIEGLDRLTAIAEARRNAILREIDRRRAAFAQALRHKIQVEDARFETIEPKAIASARTAKSAA